MTTGFDAFCRALLARADWRAALPPASLAREFVRFFHLAGFPRFQDLEQVVREAGVGEIVGASLPGALRGIHSGMTDGKYVIQYAEDEWEGSRDQTVLHETYEILQERLQDLCPGYRAPRGKQLCRQADHFAAVVLLQPAMFALFAETTGFDILALQRLYRRAYISIALRLVEVMHRQPLLVALYDRHVEGEQQAPSADAGPECFRAKVVAWTAAFFPTAGGHAPTSWSRFLPVRGRRPLPGSSAERVILSGSPVHVERVTGYDSWGTGDLTVAAQPVVRDGRVERVAVVAVPWRDQRVLGPQLEQKPFLRVNESSQVL